MKFIYSLLNAVQPNKKIKRHLLSAFILLVPGSATVQAQPVFKDTVVLRYYQFLISQPVADSNQVAKLLNTLSASGQWKDIDYTDSSIGAWQLRFHPDRMIVLATAYQQKQSAFYHTKMVKDAIDRSLLHWTTRRYKNGNWWYNAILVPQEIRDVIILMKDDLTAQQRTDALSVVAQHHVGGTGANLTWTADIGLHYGALTNNKALMDSCAKLLQTVIKQDGDEGPQPDYSFRQHGARLQMYHYGNAFVFDNIRLAWELRGTPWAYPQSAIDLITNVVLKAYWWMARGIHTVPGTIDRAVSRPGQLTNADIRSLIPYLVQLSPSDAILFSKLAAWENGDYNMLQGFRYYPYSDFTAYHTTDFSFFVKTISTRTLVTESINGENLKGGPLNNGNTWMVTKGGEYDDLMPVWDWGHLPGSTVAQPNLKIRKPSYSGGTGDAESGITAMMYVWGNSDTGLQAKKTWVTHNGVAVCLTAGVQCSGTAQPVITTLEQCRLRGAVTVSNRQYTAGVHQLKNVSWLHHAGILYVPLGAADMALRMEEKKGAWIDINKSRSAATETDTVFMAQWLHKPAEKAVAYMVMGCTDVKAAAQKAAQATPEILANDDNTQAVLFKDGTMMMAFFAVNGRSDRALPVRVNRACVLMKKGTALFAADPLHNGGELSVEYKTKRYILTLPADGTTVQLTLDKK